MNITLRHGKFYDRLHNCLSKEHMVEAVAQLEQEASAQTDRIEELSLELDKIRVTEEAAALVVKIYFEMLLKTGMSEKDLRKVVRTRINEAVSKVI